MIKIEKIKKEIKKSVDEILEGVIAIRQSGEPFFGIQTVFAPLIDKLIERRERQNPQTASKEKKVKYYIRYSFPDKENSSDRI